MKILLVYPETPHTFWSFHNALKFVSKKSSEPPLGLLTVAAILPDHWEKKLIDMNVSELKDKHIQWADYVFISGMNVHTESIKKVIRRCNTIGSKVIAGGPVFTFDKQEFEGVDHFILNEAEITLPLFLRDLEQGFPKPIYRSDQFPDIAITPVPQWELLEYRKYASLSIQYSRGCPYNCEFCSITQLNGRKPRTKSKAQLITELDALFNFGWRGSVFIVDDNFIGNKIKLKREILPALITWSEERDYPFSFYTEVSINLADDDELINLMVAAGFHMTFIGIETTNPDSLEECGKSQNLNRDLVAAVKKLQNFGLQVSGGFIVGFDNDPHHIFDQMIQFIQKSGIVTAMVGLLNAPSGTRLFQRLKSENRLQKTFSGNNTDGTMNFIPKMEFERLQKGYREVVNTIYSQKEYYERMKTFLQEFRPPLKKPVRVKFCDIQALFRSIWTLGFRENGKRFYWKLMFFTLLKYPKRFALSVTMAIYGYHFRRIAETI
jgi:radical SAM superfamily enzyme YgiQ (UPF0313 family)